MTRPRGYPGRLGQLAHGGRDGVLGDPAIAEQERRRTGAWLHPEVAHGGQADASPAGLVEDGLLVVAVGELDGGVQPGGDAAHARERVGQCLDEQVLPSAVLSPHPAQVAVELTARQEVRERLLLDAGRPAVVQVLLVGHGVQQPGWHHQPAEPERRRQRLAGRAGVDDAVRRSSLEGPDRRPVVAVLGVVVVLDGDRAAGSQPGEQDRAPVAGQDRAGGVLVGGVRTTASTSARSSSSTRMPASSTATGTISRPARAAIRRCSAWLGFSKAIRRAPWAARTRQTIPWPWSSRR